MFFFTLGGSSKSKPSNKHNKHVALLSKSFGNYSFHSCFMVMYYKSTKWWGLGKDQLTGWLTPTKYIGYNVIKGKSN